MRLWLGLTLLIYSFHGYGFDHSYKAWGLLLQKNVSTKGLANLVDYKSIKENPKDLNIFLADLKSVDRETFKKWPEEERLSFLINAYNALTIKLIVDHYPIKSIKEIGSFFQKPWGMKFFYLLGESKCLDDIEHKLIRKEFSDPRAHFALVCASIGCPNLRGEPYLPSALSSQLESATKAFFSDPDKNRFDKDKKTIFLSSIFKWYTKDFEASAETLQKYVIPYFMKSPGDLKSLQDAQIRFLDYDWALNDKK